MIYFVPGVFITASTPAIAASAVVAARLICVNK